MTFILCAANGDQVIQVSDQRLSWDGKVVTDNSNKATTLLCRNGRFAVGFTGLAGWKSFKTQAWLIDTFWSCAPPEYRIGALSERFVAKASEAFQQLPTLKSAPKSAKRLSVMISGYLTNPTRYTIANIIITNFQDFESQKNFTDAQDKFWLHTFVEADANSPPSSLVRCIGATNAFTADDERVLMEMLSEPKPQIAIVEKAAHLVRQIADRPAAGNFIGKDLVVNIIPRDFSISPSAIVKLAKGADKAILPDILRLAGPEDS
ncbi:MAG: hypothetical protein HYR94_02990, partial [Chloroflexi bacterium]|nr:hypothetical protein [Chloroflexota bacterium]